MLFSLSITELIADDYPPSPYKVLELGGILATQIGGAGWEEFPQRLRKSFFHRASLVSAHLREVPQGCGPLDGAEMQKLRCTVALSCAAAGGRSWR